MSERVVVAVVADELPPFETPIGSNRFDTPYRQRLKVEMAVEESDTLASIYERAVARLQPRAVRGSMGYTENPLETVHWAWFYEPQDEGGIDTTRKRWEVSENLITVEPSGKGVWNRSQDQIAFGDLVRAADRGLLHGDPRRPYLVLLLPQGGDAFQLAWDAVVLAWALIGDMLDARDLLKLGKQWSRDRLRRDVDSGLETARSYRDEWALSGAGPLEVIETLERRPWPLADLRMLLGLHTDDEARRVLRLFGLRPDTNDEFVLSTDAEAQLLRLVAWEAGRGNLDLRDPDADAEARIKELLETGDLRPPPWQE